MIRMKLNCDKKNYSYYKVQIVLFLINLNFITCNITTTSTSTTTTMAIEDNNSSTATTRDDNSNDFESLKANFSFDYIAEPNKISINANFNDQQLVHLKLRKFNEPKSTARSTNENNLSNLRPCTKYNITAEIKNPANNAQKFMHSQIISTAYAPPNTSLIVEKYYENRIYLKWATENKECMLASEIQVKRNFDGVEKIEKTDITKAHELTITDLKPCTKYQINLMTVNMNNSVVENISKVGKTAYIDPGEVSNVNYTNINIKSVKLNWEPSIIGKACLRNYTVKYINEKCYKNEGLSCNWTEQTIPSTNSELELTGLVSCAAYKFSILTNGQQTNKTKLEKFLTLYEPPGTVTNIRIEDLTPYNVTISWDPPDKNPACVEKYCVQIAQLDLNCSRYTNQTVIILDNLQPCQNYTVKIMVIDTSGIEGEGVEKSFTMQVAKPSEVLDPKSEVISEYIMKISWQPPVEAALCIQHYRYAVWYTESVMVSDNNSTNAYDNQTFLPEATFNDLIACTDYTIQIIPVGRDSQIEGQSKLHDFRSQERVSKQPSLPEVISKTKSSVTLTSNYVDDTNRCRVQIVRFVCKPDPTLHPTLQEAESDVTIEHNSSKYTTTIETLSPYTEYKCSASIKNIVDWSNYSEAIPVLTEEDFPGPPQNIVATVDNSTIIVSWAQPIMPNGKISTYRINILSIGPHYSVPSGCEQPEVFNDTVLLEHTIFEYKFQRGKPHYEYQFQVSASNGAGLGKYTQPATAITDPHTPDRISKIGHEGIIGPFANQSYSASVLIQWTTPCQLNGDLLAFVIEIVGERPGLSDESFNLNINANATGVIYDAYEYNVTRLQPEYSYNVGIYSVVKVAGKSSESANVTFKAPAGIPIIETQGNWGHVDIVETPNPKINALVTFSNSIFNSKMGDIQYVALLVAERYCQTDPVPASGLLDSNQTWPTLRTWQEANKNACIFQYQTTPEKWRPIANRVGLFSDDRLKYVIGNESCSSKNEYCNGPLRAGTDYAIVVRLFTNKGYSDSMLMFFKTDEMIAIYTIVLSVLGCLTFSFLLGLLIFMRKNLKEKLKGPLPIDSNNKIDVSVSKFSEHFYQMTALDNAQIINEYKLINAIDGDTLGFTNNAAKQNETKNRYTNIHPYDENRVLLGTHTGPNDYINASWVNGYLYPNEYIATQGPKYESTFDFWRMVLQCHVEVVVMLTQLMEKNNDREKCYQYYPKFNEEAIYNDIHVKCTQEINLHVYVRRLFQISRDHEQWCCTHYCFSKWPDHGVPQSPGDLIKFTKIVRSERKIPTSPVIVHCSAGVGRTGTFIGLDIIIQRMRKEKKINIFSTVQELRRQRVKMVQTCDQYKLLYQCALELSGKNSKKDKLYQKNIREDYNNENNGILLNHSAYMNSKATKMKNNNNGCGTSFVPDELESGI